MTEKIYIKNQAMFQVFMAFFSSAVVGCSSRKQDPDVNIHEQGRKIAKQAESIAVEAFQRFDAYIPDNSPPAANDETHKKKGEVIKLPT